MKTKLITLLLLFKCIALQTQAQKNTIIPLTETIVADSAYTIIWNGTSEAYRYVDKQWQRAANYDYIFNVVQKRSTNQWKSIKTLHRLHPDYDGRAGDRNQTMYFEIMYQSKVNDTVNAVVHTSLGDGTAKSDVEFRNQTLVFDVADAGAFTPYNKIMITQHYDYEKGLLTETVLLYKEKDGKKTPFMKNEEKAYFYLKAKLNGAPTTYQNK